MKNSTQILLLLVLLAPTTVALGQQTRVTNLVSQPKWEVGMDLLWLIDKNTLPRYSLLVRRKIGEHGAIRLRGGYLKNSNYLAFQQFDFNTSSLIRIGYEYQKNLSMQKGATKSLVYGGIDFFSRYENNFYFIYGVPNPASALCGNWGYHK